MPRQQTLRATIDWSHELLDERERALFRRLGTFVNGFTLEGAVAVGSGESLDELDVFDVLASLADKSLVLTEPDGDALRYRLLESTRAYAREKRDAAGERESCAERHLHYLRDRFVAVYEPYERTGRRSRVVDELKAELEDIRAALDFGLAAERVPAGAALLAATHVGWRGIGLELEAVARAHAYLAALADGEPLLRAGLWSLVANEMGAAGRTTRATEAATQAVACAKASGDPGALAHALAHALAAYARRAASLRFFDEAKTALAQAEAFPNNSVAIRLQLINHRAFLNLQSNGDVEAAARAYEELLNEYRSLGDDAEVRRTTLNLAEARHVLSETRRAIELARDVLPGARNAANRNLLVMLTMNLAAYHAAVDELPETCASAREAIREAASRDPAATLVAVALEPLALALLGDVARAARLEGYADAAIRRDGFEREFTERKTRDRLRAVLAERLPPGELAQALADGATLSPDAAVALGLQDP